jgi:hypothetical protein
MVLAVGRCRITAVVVARPPSIMMSTLVEGLVEAGGLLP